MTCPYCGADIQDQAVLCVHCGEQLSSQPTQPVLRNTKICPKCGNECHKDAVICVKCGTMFAKETHPTKNKKPKKTHNKEKRIAFACLSAIFFALAHWEIVFNGIRQVMRLQEKVDLTYIIPLILIFAGLIIFAKKKNPLPSIGFTAFTVCLVVFKIMGITKYGWNNYVIIELLEFCGYILLALVLLSKKQTKIWFLPSILITAGSVFSIIAMRDWNFSFMIFIRFSYDEIANIIASIFVCLLAKYSNKPAEINQSEASFMVDSEN